MAWIRNKMDADLFAGTRDVGARRSHVVFHVARAEDAARIDVFKTGNHFMRRLACRVNHYVQPAAVTHGHDGFDRAVLPRGVQDGIKQRNQRSHAFQGEPLGAEIARLKYLFEKVSANQTLEDLVLIDLAGRRFESLRDPAPPLRFRYVHEIRADRTTVEPASFAGGFARQRFKLRLLLRLQQAKWIESHFQVAPAAERIENALALFVGGCFREVASRGLLGRFRRFGGARFFPSCPGVPKSRSMYLSFSQQSQTT